MLDKWLKISMMAFKAKNNFIKSNNNTFEFKVFKFKDTNNGFMIIWNIKTLHAFTISRMKVDKKIVVDIVDIDSEKSDNLSELGYLPKNLIFEDSTPY